MSAIAPGRDRAAAKVRARLLATSVPIAAVVALLAWAIAAGPMQAAPANVGERAAGFSLRSLDGDVVRLSALRGRAVILNFWASWCAQCESDAAALDAAWGRLSGRPDVAMLGVVFDDPASAARSFAREHRVRWPILMDPRSRTAISYGVTGVPETVVISPEGTIVRHTIGAVTTAAVISWVEAALAEPDDG